MTELARYLYENYGECRLGSADCRCLKPRNPWLGLACPDWLSWRVNTLAELAARQAKKSFTPSQ